MFDKFFPKEFNFYDLFEKQVGFAKDAADSFKELVNKGTIDEEGLNRIRNIEHQGDDVAHTIIDQLNKTFITPFDREDIHALTKELDDVIDMINTIVSRMVVYKLKGVDKNLVEFASVIQESVNAVESVVKCLRNPKKSERRR